MLTCFVKEKSSETIPIEVVTTKEFPHWLKKQSAEIKTWIETTKFTAEQCKFRIIPNEKGKFSSVIYCVEDQENFWNAGFLPFNLPEGIYQFSDTKLYKKSYAIGWGLGAYQFARYKKPLISPAKLYLPKEIADLQLKTTVEAIYQIRDLINMPADDMGPSQLAEVAKKLAQQHGAKFSQIIGEDLLKENYASIFTVGRASDDAPRLLDLRWGNANHPKVTLVGKGVCFDSGGLDLKSSQHMLLMKKDMAGAAHVLGLARMIMENDLPISLRVLIPAVENAVSGSAYRPGDIIKSRKGTTIEINNTDAEGRLVLADALTEAVSEKPELIIDIATLTGAARVALGTELPAVFSNNEKVVEQVIQIGKECYDPMWQLPLFPLYKDYLVSQVADISNSPAEHYGGAITAALFLKEFVPDDIAWLHFDLMAWNLRYRPGRPPGGEAMTVRALFSYLKQNYH